MRRPHRPLPLRVLAAAAASGIGFAACAGAEDAGAPAAEVEAVTTTDEGSEPSPSETAAAALADAFVSSTQLDGRPFDAATLAGTDAVVWFWAPWCTICRAEAPEVAEIAARYADRVQLIGVAGRGELDAMRAFVDETGTGSVTHVADLDGDIWSAFGVYGQPAYAFIDDSGEIEVFVGGLGGDALVERIDQLLAT